MEARRVARGADLERGQAYGWAALSLYLSSWALPLFEARPNRIAAGRPVALAELLLVAVLVAVAMSAIAINLALSRRPDRTVLGGSAPWLRLFTPILVRVFAAAATLALFAGPALLIARQAETAALPRVSPGPGFWLILASSFLAFGWTGQARATGQGRAAGHARATGLTRRAAGLTRRAAGLARRAFWPVALIFGIATLGLAGQLDRFSPFMELRTQGQRFWAELARHVALSSSSFFVALILGTAGAVALSRGTALGRVLSGAAAAVQNVPSLALFGLLLPLMAALADAFPWLRRVGISGIGAAPAFLALSAYAILPIMLSGAAGLRMVDAGAKDAARGMGMNRLQLLFRVELPLALPSLAAGARTALVQTIGTTTIAALIGAGGMGYFVFQGVGQAAMDMVIIGVIPIVLLSFAADKGMAMLERALSRKADRQWP